MIARRLPFGSLAPALGAGLLLLTARSAAAATIEGDTFRGDTLRPRATAPTIAAAAAAAPTAAAATAAPSARAALPVGATIRGFLSPRGLPPAGGELLVTDSGLIFRPGDGAPATAYPLVGPVRQAGGRIWRASAVTLVYTSEGRDRTTYLFRVYGSVFETEAPGGLLEVAGHPSWLDSLRSTEWPLERSLVPPSDTAAARAAAFAVASGAYADSLYALFGRPRAMVGLVGSRGRALGRLGEYIASRDSLSLDPARITSEGQLRHALAHELAHRWLARSKGQVALLWQEVPPIRDPRRYGYGTVSEQQAEAIAFAVHFLQTTARPGTDPERDSQTLLEHYESLVPGTRILARYFALQPLYASHPLRHSLTGGE